jgi:hypothetical protein
MKELGELTATLGRDLSRISETRKLIWASLLDEMYREMELVTSKVSYRFPMEWSLNLGFFTKNIGTKGFTTPHNIKSYPFSSYGIHTKHPFDRVKGTGKGKIAPWQEKLFLQGTKLFAFATPQAVVGQYCLHFGKMSKANKHNVPRHVDDKDICPQYLVNLGDWSGAKLVTYSTGNVKHPGPITGEFETPGQLILVDARLCHEVMQLNFRGVRYSVICYQHWNEHITTAAPTLSPPQVIEI